MLEGETQISGSGGSDLVYTDDSLTSYADILNNDVLGGTTSDYNRLIQAIKGLNQGEDLSDYLDVDGALRYFAANTVLVNLDSYVSSLKHNYYLYEKDGVLTILPWDYNLSFAGFQTGSASAAVNFPMDTPVSGVSLSERPLLARAPGGGKLSGPVPRLYPGNRYRLDVHGGGEDRRPGRSHRGIREKRRHRLLYL